jgi:hypothetical protein
MKTGIRRSRGPTKFAVTIKPKQHKAPTALKPRNMQQTRRRSAFWWGFWRQLGYRAANRVVDGPKASKLQPAQQPAEGRSFLLALVIVIAIIAVIIAYSP